MSKYTCYDCSANFDEPIKVQTYYEEYYGCPVPTKTPLLLNTCPKCSSENIDDHIEEEEEENE